MTDKNEPCFDHQPLRQQCTDNISAFSCLALRQMGVTKMLKVYAGSALVLAVVGLLGLGALSQVAWVLAAASGFMALWAAMAHEKYDTLLHITCLHDRIRPESSGEDWLAYHLAERVLEEQRTAQAVTDALAAIDAAGDAADEASRVHH